MILYKLCSPFLLGQTTSTTLEGLIRILRDFEVPSQKAAAQGEQPCFKAPAHGPQLTVVAPHFHFF